METGLFSRKYSNTFIQETKPILAQAINELDAKSLEQGGVDKVISDLLEKYTLKVPVLSSREHWSQTVEDVKSDSGSQPFHKLTVVIPFKGDKDLFFIIPSTVSLNVIHGKLTNNSLSLVFVRSKLNHEELSRELSTQVDQIEEHLSRLKREFKEWNDSLGKNIEIQIQSRIERSKEQGNFKRIF